MNMPLSTSQLSNEAYFRLPFVREIRFHFSFSKSMPFYDFPFPLSQDPFITQVFNSPDTGSKLCEIASRVLRMIHVRFMLWRFQIVLGRLSGNEITRF